MSFSFFEVLLLVGIIQGFIISITIWIKKKTEADKILLSLVLTVYNLLTIKILLFTTGLWKLAWFRYIPFSFELAVQPLIFLYVTSLTTNDFRLQKKYLLHFIPFAISFLYSLIVYISVLPHSEPEVKDSIANNFLFNPVKEAEDFLSIFSAVTYWYFVVKHLIRYRKWVYNNTSNTSLPTYEWLRNIIVLFGALFLLLTINIILDNLFDFGRFHFIHWQILFVYLAVLIYYMGFRGYQQPGSQLREMVDSGNGADPPGTAQLTVDVAKPGKEQQTGSIEKEKIREVCDSLIKLFTTEKIHLNPDLNLGMLAKKLNVNSPTLSAAINTGFNKNFRNLVNEYRVEEVKVKLNDPKYSQLSLLGIAYECGFNSEASFYRIFKNAVGLSPKEYLSRQQKP